MLAKTHAILLSALRYGDSSLILKAYTQQGLQGFIVSKSKKGPFKPSMAAALSQLSFVYYDKSKGDLKRIKEASFLVPYQNLGSHPIKNCIALFLAELLSHVLQEEEENSTLFNFISNCLQELDTAERFGNHHLVFCIHLTHFLGFAPQIVQANDAFFDLINGVSVKQEPAHSHFISGQVWLDWQGLQNGSREEAYQYKLNQQRRTKLLDALLLYYRHHVKDFGVLRSVEVIQTVLS
jgi:DNA repair protein RecO (recombination protein O)